MEAVEPVKTALDEWIIRELLYKSDGFLNGHHMGAGRWLAKVSVLLLLDRLPSSMLSMKGTDTKWFLKPLARLCLDRGHSCLSRQQVLDRAEPWARLQLRCQPLSALMLRDNCLPELWSRQQTSAKLMGDCTQRSGFSCYVRQNTLVLFASERQKVRVRTWAMV